MDRSMLRTYQTMARVQNIISSSDTLDSALRDGTRTIADEMDAEGAILWYAENDVLRPYFWMGPLDITSERRRIGEGVVGRVFETQKAVRILGNTPESDEYIERSLRDKIEITSVVTVPFSSMTEDLGVLQLINKRGGAFTEEEADVIEMFSMLAAIALTEKESLAEPKDFGEPLLTVRDITRDYANGDTITHVLKGIDLDVYEGEFLVLLGESGCGKSTLMNIMAGLDAPTSGSVEFLGRQIVGASQDELTEYRRANIGFIFQNYNLMPNLNARQNLDLIGELVDNPMSAAEALGLVGLADRMENYPSQMSGGQQQRVSIARAIVKRPRLIFADEPTAALDYTTSIEVLQVMERILESGTTLVMVTHNEEICRMADRVVRIRNGRVSEITINRTRAAAADLVW